MALIAKFKGGKCALCKQYTLAGQWITELFSCSKGSQLWHEMSITQKQFYRWAHSPCVSQSSTRRTGA
jgi:hypothetical protein